MKKNFQVHYVTLQRRTPKHKRVEAETPEEAIAMAPRDCGGVEAVWEVDGRLLWHVRTGFVDDVVVKEATSEIWPCSIWSKSDLIAYLDQNSNAGLFVTGGKAYVTANFNSGQSQNLQAVVSFRTVFELVAEGRLNCKATAFQKYWFYHQGPCDIGGLAFPTTIPTSTMAMPSGPRVSRVLGLKEAA